MMYKNKVLLGCLLAVLNQSALAQSPTLERIKKTGTLHLGYSETVIPISWYDAEAKQPRGYGFELSLKIVEGLKTTLKMPDLKVEYVAVPSKDRWKMHKEGTIDLHCSVTTNTVERQKELVDFSYGYFVAHAKMLVKKGSGIQNYNDLAGKNVAVIADSFGAKFLQSKKQQFKIANFEVISTGLKDGFQKLKNGEVAALVYDDISLASFLMRNPDDQPHYEVVGKALTTEYYGCTLQHGDSEFKELVNNQLKTMMIQREVGQLYDKWFTQPIEPQHLTVGIPMSNETQTLISVPNDKAVGQLGQ